MESSKASPWRHNRDRLGYLKSLVELGLESEEIGPKFKEYLQTLKL